MYIQGTDNCGIDILIDLSKEANIKRLKKIVACEVSSYGNSSFGELGTVLSATTIRQQKAAEKMLRDVGFTELYSFVNANTGNVVTSWVMPYRDLTEKLGIDKEHNFKTKHKTKVAL